MRLLAATNSSTLSRVSEPEEVIEKEQYAVPPLPFGVAAGVAGAVCGLLTVGLVWLAERGCDGARGAASCGSLGLPLLLLIVVATIVAGVVLLRRLLVPNAGLTAFLGVCFMLLVVVGFLADRLSGVWSLLVVPVLSAVTFVIARYVTRRLYA